MTALDANLLALILHSLRIPYVSISCRLSPRSTIPQSSPKLPNLSTWAIPPGYAHNLTQLLNGLSLEGGFPLFVTGHDGMRVLLSVPSNMKMI